ncbi:hypothetical protein DL764_010035 [Monosporascus ibericus]|uniref:Uncharacterized protein n=1 Tax=Monosporascus ibericus TaxID=155417 RepID=A0A4Q4SVT8_9PEZI|nr:hypothetical protein DL764_010035 [Monosporascus ibericus]
MSAIKIEWKTEFLHKLVFQKTVEGFEGPLKLDEPLTKDIFDNSSDKLGKAAGFPDKLRSYDDRRGNLEILDRYRLGSWYRVPSLTILNHISQRYDENAPTGVSDEFMRLIGPDSTVCPLEGEVVPFPAELAARYKKLS